MKNLKLAVFFLLLYFTYLHIDAQQTTWIKTLVYHGYTMNNPLHQTDSASVGPYEFATSKNNLLMTLVNDDTEGNQSLYILGPNGSTSSFNVGSYATLQYWRAYDLKATPDNSYTYISYHYDYGNLLTITYTLMKGGSAIHSWVQDINTNDVLSEVIPNFHNSYYCLVNGNWIDYPSGNPVNLSGAHYIFGNDDILFEDTNLTRKDTSGNIIWTLSRNGYLVIANSDSILYASKTDSLEMIDATMGTVIWTKYFNAIGSPTFQNITNGLVFLNGRDISVFDSSGNYVSQNTINFTHYLPRFIATSTDGAILTGGSFIGTSCYNYDKGYCPVIIRLDQNAHGTIDSTDFFYHGDADHDYSVSFSDDAVVVAAAFGVSNSHPDLNHPIYCGQVNYAADWSQSFQSGLNYKYVDNDFNGIINQNDLVNYYGYAIDSYGYSHSNPNGSLISVIVDNSNPNIGDTFNVIVTIGDSINAIDSIYGISICMAHSNGIHVNLFDVSFRNGVLGDTAIDLYSYTQNFFGGPANFGTVLCRTDHSNISLLKDTLLQMKAVITYYYNSSMPPAIIPVAHAITKGGYTVPLKSEGVTFDSITLRTPEVERISGISIYPNPATDYFTVFSPKEKIVEIIIRDATGAIVGKSSCAQFKCNYSTNKLLTGLFFVEIKTDSHTYFKKLVVEK